MRTIILIISFGLSLIGYSQNHYETYLSQSYGGLNKKNYELALENIENGINSFPDSNAFHILKGQVKMAQDSAQIALISFNKAIALDSNSAFAFYNRSKAYKKLGNSFLMCEDILTAINLGEFIYTTPFSEEGCRTILNMDDPNSKYSFPPPPPEMSSE